MPPLIQARPSNPMQSSLASHEWLRTRPGDACPKREATGTGTLPTTWSAVCLVGTATGVWPPKKPQGAKVRSLATALSDGSAVKHARMGHGVAMPA